MAGPPKLFQEIKALDEDLALQLENLKPKEGEKVLQMSWLTRLLVFALDKHIEAVSLIPPLDFPLLVSDEKWMNEYMDLTARMLDVCNSLTGALSNIEQGHLLIRHACHILVYAENAPLKKETQSSTDASMVEDHLARAHKSLCEWVNLQALSESTSPRYSPILQDMIKDLMPPRQRDLGKGKGFLYALHGANTTAVLALYVLALAVLQESELLSLSLSIPPAAAWSGSVSHIVEVAKDEVKARSSNACFEDLGALDSSVTRLLGLIESALELKEMPLAEGVAKELAEVVNDLCAQMDEVAKGLERLGTTLNEMFKVIVSSRSALLDKLGDFGTENL